MSTTSPSVYVGTYHKYNCGSIFGKWMDLTDFDDKDEFYEACNALHNDEEDPELMFQDWEGIPDGLASESHINWDFIEAYKQAVEEGNGGAFFAWTQYSLGCDYDAFQNAYLCEAESEEEYAYQLVEECGLLDGMPEALRGYFDYEAYARDLFSSDYVFYDGYVFSNR